MGLVGAFLQPILTSPSSQRPRWHKTCLSQKLWRDNIPPVLKWKIWYFDGVPGFSLQQLFYLRYYRPFGYYTKLLYGLLRGHVETNFAPSIKNKYSFLLYLPGSTLLVLKPSRLGAYCFDATWLFIPVVSMPWWIRCSTTREGIIFHKGICLILVQPALYPTSYHLIFKESLWSVRV